MFCRFPDRLIPPTTTTSRVSSRLTSGTSQASSSNVTTESDLRSVASEKSPVPAQGSKWVRIIFNIIGLTVCLFRARILSYVSFSFTANLVPRFILFYLWVCSASTPLTTYISHTNVLRHLTVMLRVNKTQFVQVESYCILLLKNNVNKACLIIQGIGN